jgi:hypothetical protein
MNSLAKRKCRHCLRVFVPDYRNAHHQRFCSEPFCRLASKQCSQRRWLRKPANRNYFREPDNASRVRQWRQVHPGYWRTRPSCGSLDLASPPEPESPIIREGCAPQSTGTLQDFCRSKTPVLTGLVARLAGCTLQEDIARCALLVVCEAQCILLRCPPSGSAGSPAGGLVNYHETG